MKWFQLVWLKLGICGVTSNVLWTWIFLKIFSQSWLRQHIIWKRGWSGLCKCEGTNYVMSKSLPIVPAIWQRIGAYLRKLASYNARIFFRTNYPFGSIKKIVHGYVQNFLSISKQKVLVFYKTIFTCDKTLE